MEKESCQVLLVMILLLAVSSCECTTHINTILTKAMLPELSLLSAKGHTRCKHQRSSIAGNDGLFRS